MVRVGRARKKEYLMVVTGLFGECEVLKRDLRKRGKMVLATT
jgi:hypothetical protein